MDEVRLGSRTLQPGRQLLVGGRREPIGKRALDILSVLAEAKGEIVTKDELLEAVWPGVTVEENALQVHIVALRKALGPEADRLKTIRGVGYQLEIDGEMAEDAGDVRAELAVTPAVAAGKSSPGSGFAAAWAKARSHRLALTLAAVLAVLMGGWAIFGGDIWPRSGERIPVVVRALTASATGDRTEGALASGITDELIVRLRRIPELRVATGDADGRLPGEAFNGAYVVDGSIRRSGDRLRVTARLTDAGGEILWSQTFDRGVADLFEVQEAIAASISDALGVSLDVGANSAAYGGTDNPEAFAAYLEYKTHVFDPEQSVPVRYLERALSIDPDYVKALAALSTSYGIQSNLAATRERALALLAKMDESTARAVAANPDLWIGHMARGNYYNERRDFASAARSFRRVAELDQGIDPELRDSLAIYALINGRARKAIALLDGNEAIDPITRHSPLRMWALASEERYAEAVELFDAISANNPGQPQPFIDHVFWSHLLLQRKDEALRFAEVHDVKWLGPLKAFEADKALPTLSEGELRQWTDRHYAGGGHFELANNALFASYLGHPKLAVDLLRLAFERPGGYGIGVLWHPGMAAARKTDAFRVLVTDLGLVKFWRESGQWPDACRPLSETEITCS